MSPNYKIINLADGKDADKHYYLFEPEGCLYHVNKTKTNKKGEIVKYLKCIDCQCRATLKNGNISRTNEKLHNHVLHIQAAEVEVVYEELKKKVIDSKRPVRELHTEMLRSVSTKIARELPWKKVGQTLQNVRKKIFPPCKNIESFVTLMENNEEIGAEFGSFRGQPLYRGAISVDGSTAVVFLIEQHLKLLEPNFNMSCDGTFSVVPLGFVQLFILMAEIEGRPRILAYILMEKRTSDLYFYVFEYLRDSFNIKPGSIMIDFELASREAAREVWPDSSIDGCNFHFAKALRKKASKLGFLSRNYKSKEIRTTLRMYMRLSLLPIEKITEGVDTILAYQKKYKIEKEFKKFHKYFQQTWFGRYQPSDWCVSKLKRRTNNDVEALNRVVKTVIPRNPNVYTFMEGMMNLIYRNNNDLEAENSHGMAQRSSKSKLENPLKEALAKLAMSTITVENFLLSLAAVGTNYHE